MYSRQTECAFAAMGRLAEAYDGGETVLSASEIADSRNLQRPFVAKILSTLARAGLVVGSRGPGGGFTLACHPGRTKLYDVFSLFERSEAHDRCPFGGGRCGVDQPCPLHDRLGEVRDSFDRLLHGTTFEAFLGAVAPGSATGEEE